MSDYFKNTIDALSVLGRGTTFTMEILPDKDGYIDKECPNERCRAQFKIHEEDWVNKVSDDAVFCPFCGFSAPAENWFTTEQVEVAQKQAMRMISASIGKALKADSRDFNRRQPRNSFVKVSMSYDGPTSFVSLPAEAMEEMEQKIQCENCGTRYSVIGSAFFCPCCGKNSARQTFANTINKVQAKVNNIEKIREVLARDSKDVASRTCTSLLESSISDLVIALQRVCECVYPQLQNSKPLKQNVFQRLNDGSVLWKELTGEGYEDWLTPIEMKKLRICFQQRHLLQHKDGIVDQEYISKSGDSSYLIGQRIVINKSNVLDYVRIVEKLGTRVIELSSSSKSELLGGE